MTESYSTHHRRYYRRSSLVGPVLLVGMGVLLLLNNFNMLPRNSWVVIFRLWPVFLILLGIDILFGRRSLIGTVISSILLLGIVGGLVYLLAFTPEHPLLQQLTQNMGPTRTHFNEALNEIEYANVNIDWNASNGSLEALNDSIDLIAGDITYYNTLDFSVSQIEDHADVHLNDINNGAVFFFDLYEPEAGDDWLIGLHPSVDYDLHLDASSGDYYFDLSALQLNTLELDASSGDIELLLPTGEYRVRIDASSGDIEIKIPAGVGVRIEFDGSSGALLLGDEFELIQGEAGGDGIWESENYLTAEARINLMIDASSGNINIDYMEK